MSIELFELINKEDLVGLGKYLETHDIDEQTDTEYPSLFIYRGYTGLIYASRKGNTKVVKISLKSGASVDIQDKNGDTALHWVARYGYKEIVKLLLEAGASVNIQNIYVWTALHWGSP